MALSIKTQEKIADLFYDKFRSVETDALNRIAEQIGDIGTLNISNLNKLEQVIIMNGNLSAITEELATLTKTSQKEIEKLLTEIATEQYSSASKFFTASGVKQVSIEQNKALQNIISSVARQTASTMANYSNTTILSTTYQDALDKATLAVVSGVSDYNSSMKSVIRELSSTGISFVDYKSGNTRRLDSAVRMNMMDAMHQVNMGVAEEVGKEFGADGVEITSHSNPAPDHKQIDGKQMTMKEFERFQKKAKRPIGQFNCYHFAIPIIIGVSEPSMTEKERKAKQKKEDAKVSFGGQSKTKYEWTQEQRKLETQARYYNDTYKMAKTSGNDALKKEAYASLKQTKEAYKKMSDSVGLDYELNRVF